MKLRIFAMTAALFLICACILTACQSSPELSDGTSQVADTSSPDTAQQETSAPVSDRIEETRAPETAFAGTEHIRTDSYGATDNWAQWEFPGDLGKCTYSVLLPEHYTVDYTVMYADGRKMGEFAPPVKLGEGQVMPNDITTEEYEASYGMSTGQDIPIFGREFFTVGDCEILMFAHTAHSYNIETGEPVTFHPYSFYIKTGDTVVTLFLYAWEIPMEQELDLMKSIAASVKIIEG